MPQEILCNYQKGEERGVGLLIQLKTFAPTQTHQELAEQIEDERKHDRLFSGRLKDLGIDCQGMNNSLEKVYDLAQECVDRRDWVESITIQTVIEELAFATFTDHLPELDADTQTVLEEIIRDEVKHLQFGLRELEKVAKGNEEKIRKIHLQVMGIFKGIMGNKKLDVIDLKRIFKSVAKAYKMHKKRLSKIGIEIPKVSEAIFVKH